MITHFAYPLLAVLFWAGNTVVNKLAAANIEPTEIGFYRWLFAALLLTPFLLRPTLRNWRVIRPNLIRIVILGFLGMTLFQSLAYFSAIYTSATHMAVIQALMPSISLALAILVLGQALTRGAVFGAIVSFFGALLVVSNGQPARLLETGMNMGDGLMLIAVAAYSLYSVLLRKWPIQIPTLQLLYLQMLVAVLVQLPLFLCLPQVGLNSSNLPLVFYACLFASILAPLAWMHGIRLIGPGRASLFFNLTPVFTLLIAAIVLSERIGFYHWLGVALTILGVVLGERWKRPWRAS